VSVALLALAVLIFAWPELSLAARGTPASYPVVTVAFTLLVAGLVVTWGDRNSSARQRRAARRAATAAFAVLSAAAVLVAVLRWTRLTAWLPYHADMLIVIREATRRFLTGHTPYATYRSYDTTWDMVMPYGPALWGPFLVPQLLRLDFRILTIIGELFVPAWCGVASIVEASRGRITAALSWLALLAVLLIALDVQRFTLIAHTPVYWPLFFALAALIRKRHWTASAVLLGLLVAARQTMVSMIPVFVMTVWMTDRRSTLKAVGVLAATIAAVLGPFVVWDARAMWESMVLSYPRVMKSAVWPVLARPGLETIGITEWLIEHHREWLVTPVQLATLSGTYAAAWVAMATGRNGNAAGTRARSAIPWMALSLFTFSMTTLYPVNYLYYDVLLLLACARLAETLEAAPAFTTSKGWAFSLVALAAVTCAGMRAAASPVPSIAAGQVSGDVPFRSGFEASESDGSRTFSWIVGNDARIVLPRSSASTAEIVLVAQSPFRDNQPPQRMAAILNGTLLAEVPVPAGWQEIRVPAPHAAWWIGFNELQLQFSSTVSPRDTGSGTDPRRLALGLSRVDVVKRNE
jgi:hypothetical protein